MPDNPKPPPEGPRFQRTVRPSQPPAEAQKLISEAYAKAGRSFKPPKPGGEPEPADAKATAPGIPPPRPPGATPPTPSAPRTPAPPAPAKPPSGPARPAPAFAAEPRPFPPPPKGEWPPPYPPPEEKGAGDAAGRTTLPPKQRLRCYECGYEYDLTGRLKSTHCPKCRVALDLAGFTVDADCREELKTLATIRVTPRGIVRSAKLVAMDLELAGRMAGCEVEVFRRLTLLPGADFMKGEIRALDLRVDAGADTNFKGHAIFRNVEVIGHLQASVFASGTVTLRSTAGFTGSICAPRLVVEDGATLVGQVRVSPDSAAEVEKVREQAPSSKDNPRIMVGTLPAAMTAPAFRSNELPGEPDASA